MRSTMIIYKELLFNNNNDATMDTLIDLCQNFAKEEFLNLVKIKNIDINTLKCINDIEDYTDINVLGMSYNLMQELTTQSIIRIAEAVQYHINKEVIPNIEYYYNR